MAGPKESKEQTKQDVRDEKSLPVEARIELLANLLVERIAEEIKINAA